MATALIPIIDGFEEIEAVSAIDILRRAGVNVTTAGIGKPKATGSHNITMETDTTFDEARESDFDAVVLPGGPGAKKLNAVEGLHDLLRRYAEGGKLVAAICAAPAVLARAGLLKGRRATCYPSVEDQLAGAEIDRASVVVDGNIVTSRGAGTAVEFALAVSGFLAGQDKAHEVARSIVHGQPTVEV